MYLRLEPDYLHEDWLAKTVPIQMSRVILGHSIPERKNVAFFNLLDNFNVGFGLSVTFAFSFLAILALLFLLSELSRLIRPGRRKTITKRIALAVRSFSADRLSAIGVFVVFVQLFIWINELFLTNNIKTNKVVSLTLHNEAKCKLVKNVFISGGGHIAADQERGRHFQQPTCCLHDKIRTTA